MGEKGRARGISRYHRVRVSKSVLPLRPKYESGAQFNHFHDRMSGSLYLEDNRPFKKENPRSEERGHSF